MLTWGLIIRHILVENPSFIVFNQGSPMVVGPAEHQHGRRQRRKLKRSFALARWSSRKVQLHWHWLKPTRNAKNLGASWIGSPLLGVNGTNCNNPGAAKRVVLVNFMMLRPDKGFLTKWWQYWWIVKDKIQRTRPMFIMSLILIEKIRPPCDF